MPPNSKEQALDSCVTSEENIKPWLDLYTKRWPKNKDFQELQEITAEGRQFSQDNQPSPKYPFVVADSYFVLPSPHFLLKTQYSSAFLLLKRRETSLTVGSATGNSDLLTMSDILCSYPERTSHLSQMPLLIITDVMYQARLLQLGVPIPCFNHNQSKPYKLN